MKNNRIRFANQALVFSILAMTALVKSGVSSEDIKQQAERTDIIQKAKEGDIHAVQILGESHDASLIPILTNQLTEARQANFSPTYIRALRKSLACLGHPASRKEITEEIESNDRYVQYHAIEDAGEIGGSDMVVKLAEKLLDPSPGGRPFDQDGTLVTDVGLPAPRHAAVVALSRIINDPTAPHIDLKRIAYNEENVQKWRKWWEVNKGKYDAGH
jgi:hypothetical protein